MALMSLRTEVARLLDPGTFTRFENIATEAQNAAHIIQESLDLLQQTAREDRGWVRMVSGYDQIFDRTFIDQLIKVARVFFLKNPIIRRAVLLQSYYVFGRGVEIRIDQEGDQKPNEFLQEFLRLNGKHLGVTGLTEMEQDVQNSGNLFIAAFSDPNLGTVKIRTIDALEIQQIITNPDDADEPWFYRRRWSAVSTSDDGIQSSTTRDEWYPAMTYTGEAKQTIGSNPVNSDVVVYHRRVGAPSKSLWGYPETFAALDWATAYKEFLTSWLTKEQALSRLALDIKTPGGAKAIEAQKAKLATTLSTDSRERNPAPDTGSAWITGPNQTIQTIKTAGSNTSPDEARRAFLMAIMLFGPETFFGDASVGSLATATSLDRPTELKFLHAQARWKEDLSVICGYAVSQGSTAPAGAIKVAGNRNAPTVLVSFPPILEHDLQTQIGAIVSAATLDGQVPAGTIDQRTLCAMLLHVLGVNKVDDIVEKMYPAGSYNPLDWAAASPEERAALAADITAKAGAAAVNTPPNSAESLGAVTLAMTAQRLLEAVKDLKRA